MSFKKINALGAAREPFLFLCDYLAQKVIVVPLKELKNEDIEFSIKESRVAQPHNECLRFQAVPFAVYSEKFAQVIEKIKSGDTYLLNLTLKTPVETELSLKEIFTLANARYKIRYRDEFVCFSPETFIQIRENTIHTFPMKGTIDASIEDAEEKILADKKEIAEHVMIVDLLRNDLSMVASAVKVNRFRYIEKIAAGQKELLQISSHISGDLSSSWHENIGSILEKLLPAGSISGTPKKSTLSIIENVEGYERGFFSGVFGVYDGESLDSGVMIRFVQKDRDSYVYKSGGGITLDSDLALEYQEYQDKIYLP